MNDSVLAKSARTRFRRPPNLWPRRSARWPPSSRTAVKDVFGAVGGLATDVFEIREGVRRAQERTDDPVE